MDNYRVFATLTHDNALQILRKSGLFGTPNDEGQILGYSTNLTLVIRKGNERIELPYGTKVYITKSREITWVLKKRELKSLL